MNIVNPLGLEGELMLILQSCPTGIEEKDSHLGHFSIENREGDEVFGTVRTGMVWEVDVIRTAYHQGYKAGLDAREAPHSEASNPLAGVDLSNLPPGTQIVPIKSAGQLNELVQRLSKTQVEELPIGGYL